MTSSDDTLRALGVRADTLSADEKRRLDEDGFLPLENVITPEQARRMLQAMESLFAAERTGRPEGASECGNMQNKSDAFDICVTHPRVLAAVAHVLREEFVSMGVHSRPNPPGKGDQGLHVDYGGPELEPGGGTYYVCNSIWPLADFTEENGATRVVPGSHRTGRPPEAAGADPMATQPGEVRLVAPVGTVVIFNSHLWHGSALNRSSGPRPNVTSYWSRRRLWDGRRAENPLSRAAWSRLPAAARALFDPPAAP